jgi:hypothetical protein
MRTRTSLHTSRNPQSTGRTTNYKHTFKWIIQFIKFIVTVSLHTRWIPDRITIYLKTGQAHQHARRQMEIIKTIGNRATKKQVKIRETRKIVINTGESSAKEHSDFASLFNQNPSCKHKVKGAEMISDTTRARVSQGWGSLQGLSKTGSW